MSRLGGSELATLATARGAFGNRTGGASSLRGPCHEVHTSHATRLVLKHETAVGRTSENSTGFRIAESLILHSECIKTCSRSPPASHALNKEYESASCQVYVYRMATLTRLSIWCDTGDLAQDTMLSADV